ncbi:hypothetical protein EDD17DRAFT_1646522 [Pisolithus thermaeus]|nr:hypothetical protein EDD17DRAFT_1646522 [Pisolithus thermaeus]
MEARELYVVFRWLSAPAFGLFLWCSTLAQQPMVRVVLRGYELAVNCFVPDQSVLAATISPFFPFRTTHNHAFAVGGDHRPPTSHGATQCNLSSEFRVICYHFVCTHVIWSGFYR